MGFLRWSIPLNSFLWKVLALQQHSRFSIAGIFCFLWRRMHCACDLVGIYGPEIPVQSVKGPNALVPLQWVHSWIRHDPYSHTTQAWPIEHHVFRGRQVCRGLRRSKAKLAFNVISYGGICISFVSLFMLKRCCLPTGWMCSNYYNSASFIYINGCIFV